MWFNALYGVRIQYEGPGLISMGRIIYEPIIGGEVVRLRIEWWDVEARGPCYWVGLVVPGQPMTEVVRTPHYRISVSRDLPSSA